MTTDLYSTLRIVALLPLASTAVAAPEPPARQDHCAAALARPPLAARPGRLAAPAPGEPEPLQLNGDPGRSCRLALGPGPSVLAAPSWGWSLAAGPGSPAAAPLNGDPGRSGWIR